MNAGSQAIARWLEHKRRMDRTSAAVFCVLALGSGTAVFLLCALPLYAVLSFVSGRFIHSALWAGLLAFGLTASIFIRIMEGRRDGWQLGLDPMGLWILKDILSVGPRLFLEGVRQARCCRQLKELNVAACAHALAYLAGKNAAVSWADLIQHCPHSAPSRLREQLALIDGVLFLGEAGARVTLMDPFRLRLRWMLDPEPIPPRREPAPSRGLVNDPETLTAYEILGVSPSASVMEIKTAYRKRVKECHPDLFVGMDQHAKALAERWTRALNAAYASLNPRPGAARPGFSGPR